MCAGDEDRTLLSARLPEVESRVTDTTVSLSGPESEPPPRSQPVKVVEPPLPDLGEKARYVKLAVVGRGGMGRVLRAFDLGLERHVAIKVLNEAISDEPRDMQIKRFNREARITGQLEHPYIVPVHDLGTAGDGEPYFCMKFVQGETLEGAVKSAGEARLDPDHLADLLQIFIKVCDAVSFAHDKGIIHLDLKPSNIMIGDFGQVYVLDWGLSRYKPGSESEDSDLEPPSCAGTLPYAAPEQWQGRKHEIDERTDIFALGATLYEILTGEAPNSQRFLMLNQEVPPPEEVVRGASVPAELSRIVRKAMAPLPEHRYASVTELKADIERFQRSSWHLPRRKFAPGEVILKEGDEGTEAHIIASGTCLAYLTDDGEEVPLREMGPGDVFGETAVFANKPRSCSVRAVGEVELMVVTREILSHALGLNLWMGRFVKALADRFREVDERLRQHEQGERRSNPPPSRR